MMESDVKKKLIEICRRMYERHYIAGVEGNVSARLGQDVIVVSPSGVCKGDLSVGDLVTVDRHGKKLTGRRSASSELKVHLMAYAERQDVGAVVHGHPPTATGYAVAGLPLPPRATPEAVMSLGPVPLVPYATPSTAELAGQLRPWVKRADAFLLANHGVLAFGATLDEAYYRLETVEQYARIVLTARLLGGVEELTEQQVQELMDIERKRTPDG